jgi:Xaa-Pro aminopeptidase
MKIKELQHILKKKKIDFALFCNIDFSRFDYEMAYFSGYGGVGALIIPQNKKPFLIVHKMEAKRAKKGGIKVYSPQKIKRLSAFAKEKLRQNGIKWRRIGVNKEEITIMLKEVFQKVLKKSKFLDLRKELYQLRETKTKKEIEIIRKGCKISDEILKNCFSQFKKFKTEAEVKAFLEYEVNKRGCGLAFPTIVASGPNASKAHHESEDTILKKGFCVIDFGLRYKNYCTDTTRTIYLGKPTKKEIDIYNFLLNVQKNIIKGIKLKQKYSKVFEHAIIELGKYSKYFTHGLGHGFGIKIHELPDLTEKSKNKVMNNQVFTVEPGIYLNKFGIRIEDDILVKDNKIIILTRIPKDLLVVK